MYRQLWKSGSAKAGLAFSALFAINNIQDNQIKNCGIVGIVSKKKKAKNYLMEGIEILQNRGYDSAGIALVSQQSIEVRKLATDYLKGIDCIEHLKQMVDNEDEFQSYSGIGHTRWATCGAKTDINAHPHIDSDSRVVLVHNGTLEDVQEMRVDLYKKGVSLRTETDSEIIVQYIGYYLKQGISLQHSCEKVLKQKIKGTWGLVVIDKMNPSQMVVARNGSPLLIGLAQDTFYVASERVAFEKYTQNYIQLEDNELLLLDINQIDHAAYQPRVKIIQETNIIEIQPQKPYRYFYEQEIYHQQDSILRVLGNGSRLGYQPDNSKLGGLEQHKTQIAQIDNMLIIGCGTSLYAGQFVARIFKRLGCFNTIQCIEASEFQLIDIPKEKAGAIFISQSGETADIYKCLQISKNEGLFTIGVINTVGSLIANNVHCGVYLNCGREVAVPATKSFTSQVVVLTLIAIFVSKLKDHDNHYYNNRVDFKEVLSVLPSLVTETIQNIRSQIVPIVESISDTNNLIILGKGSSLAIAKEGALKIKEITYIHAESLSAGEMKHGPIALLHSEQPKTSKMILIILDDEYLQDMLLTLSEMHSRNAFIIVVTDCADKIDQQKVDQQVQIRHLQMMTPLLVVIFFQLLCLEVGIRNKLNPDKPRNLAKTVTVG